MPRQSTRPDNRHWLHKSISPLETDIQSTSKSLRSTQDQTLTNPEMYQQQRHIFQSRRDSTSDSQQVSPPHQYPTSSRSSPPPLYYSPLQNPYDHLPRYFGSGSSSTSISYLSNLTQVSDPLGIEMAKAFLAEEPVLDHILAVDVIPPR